MVWEDSNVYLKQGILNLSQRVNLRRESVYFKLYGLRYGQQAELSVARSVQLGYIHRLFPVINSSTVEHEENSSDMLAEHQTYP